MQTAKKRILLVDDDPSLQSTLSDFLSLEGYEVMCCSSGEEAILAMRPFSPDLVILDMGMPGMGGTGFLESILMDDGSTLFPVLVLTARASMAAYFADKRVAGFIAKPADSNDLLSEIGRILFEYPVTPEEKAERAVAGAALIVDPEDAFASRLALEFARLGYAPDQARSAQEALAMAAEQKPVAFAISTRLPPPMTAQVLKTTLGSLPDTKESRVALYGEGGEVPEDVAAVSAALPASK